MGIFESGDPWSHCSGISISIQLQPERPACIRTFTRLEDVWVCLMDGLPKLKLRSGDGSIASTGG